MTDETEKDFVDDLMARAFDLPAPEMPDFEKSKQSVRPPAAKIQAQFAANMERVDIYEITQEPQMKKRALQKKAPEKTPVPVRRGGREKD